MSDKSDFSITCPNCGRTSYNLNDVEQRYCVACHRFADDPPPQGEPIQFDASKWVSDDNKPPPEATTELDPKKFLIDSTTAAGWMFNALEQPPTFPFTITVGGTSLVLHADGKWDGDLGAVKQAMRDMKGQYNATGAILLWLALRWMIRDDERFW